MAQATLTVAGPPASILVSTAIAGNEPATVTRASTYTLRVKPVDGVKHITAQIDAAMPAFTTLSLNMAAPSTGTSQGTKNLTTVAQNMVNSISGINPSESPVLTYVFTATVAAGVIASQSRIVTFTMLTGP
jgi:hypothetical protein